MTLPTVFWLIDELNAEFADKDAGSVSVGEAIAAGRRNLSVRNVLRARGMTWL